MHRSIDPSIDHDASRCTCENRAMDLAAWLSVGRWCGAAPPPEVVEAHESSRRMLRRGTGSGHVHGGVRLCAHAAWCAKQVVCEEGSGPCRVRLEAAAG
jgi:hypothetical protein